MCSFQEDDEQDGEEPGADVLEALIDQQGRPKRSTVIVQDKMRVRVCGGFCARFGFSLGGCYLPLAEGGGGGGGQSPPPPPTPLLTFRKRHLSCRCQSAPLILSVPFVLSPLTLKSLARTQSLAAF